MKRILFGLVVAASLVAKSDDSYLYWMVSSNPGFTYTSANLVAAVEASEPWDNDSVEGGISKSDLGTARDFGDGIYSALGKYASDGYTYFIELVNDNKVVAYSEGLAFSKASAYMSSLTQFDPGASSLWTASNFTAVPEPTSGLMVLLGMAALALRRRRRA